MKIDGACHCGFIRYEAEVDPEKTAICHCTDCQTLSGAPFRASVPAQRADTKFLNGEPAIYVKIAESGARRAQAFCPKCGSPIYATAADDPTAPYNLRLGAIRQRGDLAPRRQSWVRSAQPWIKDVASIQAS